MAIWLASSSSCVLAEVTTANLCGQFAAASNACGTCSSEACCDEERACRDSNACAALYDCLAPCDSDPACIAACADAQPSDAAALALARCHVAMCSLTCASCALGLDGGTTDCDDCIRVGCCESYQACADDLSCGAAAKCVAGCTVPGCVDRCNTMIDLAPDPEQTRQRYTALALCGITACQQACEVGAFFDCKGNFAWPVAEQTQLLLDLSFAGVTAGPAVGVTVDACEPFDANCGAPIASDVTDSAGNVVLDVPISDAGFTGFFKTTGDDRIPGLHYSHEPMLRDRASFWTSLTVMEGDLVGQLLGAPFEPDRGHLVVVATDCRSTAALGIQFDVGEAADSESTKYFLVNGVPSTAPTATSAAGRGGWVNLKPGTITLQARLEETSEVVSSLVVTIRAGSLTDVVLSPDPR